MGRKADLRRVDRIAREAGLTPEERRDYGDYLESCKRHGDRGSRPNGDYTDDELRAKAEEFKEGLSRFRDQGEADS